jgi:hypothetical protein
VFGSCSSSFSSPPRAAKLSCALALPCYVTAFSVSVHFRIFRCSIMSFMFSSRPLMRACNSCSTAIPNMSGDGDLPSLLLSAADTSDALLFLPFFFHWAFPHNNSCSISSQVGLCLSSMACAKNIFLYLWLVRIIHPTLDIHMDACGLIQRQ